MADRTVKVRLEADISDFVGDIGVKAVAAVKKLEASANQASATLKKTATDGAGIGDGVQDGTSKATSEVKKFAADTEKTMASAGAKVSKTFEKAGDGSGKNFNQSLKKWFSPSTLGKAGQEGGTVFGSGFLGMLKTPVLGPLLLAALAGAVAVAAPAAGAIAASGLVLGFGAGLAGLGIVFAAKSKPVQDSWKKTLSGMAGDMQLFAKPYEATLTHAADVADRVFGRFAPSLQASFKETAPVVSAFVDDLGSSLEELQPAVRPLSEAFQAVLQSLGPAMQSAVHNVSQGLQELSESVKENPDGLADLVDGMGQLTGKALGAISVLNDFNGKIEDLTGGMSAVDLVFGKANSKVGEFLGTVKSAIDPLGGLKSGFDALFGSADNTTGAVGLTGDAVKMYTQGLDDNAVKAILAGKANTSAGAAVESLAAKFDRQWQATQKSNDALTRQSGLLLTLSGSQIAYQQAVDDATAAVKENGHTHDINTEKGRANKTALDQVAASANAQTIAMRNAGDGNVSAAKHAEGARQAFVKQAIQMGYSKKEAEALAAKLIAIPNVSRTAKLNANITDLETKLATAKTKLKDPKLTAEQKAKLNADITRLEAGIAAAKRALASVPTSKTVSITTNLYRNMVETTTHVDKGVRLNADGGYYPTSKIPSYANGKLPSQATIAPGKGSGMVQWAEQETGGEAFIPLAPSKRDRSEKILGQVADSFGLGLVKSFASGGQFVDSPSVDPRRYISGTAGGGWSGSSTSREVHVHQNNYFSGVSMAEADLIAQRANAKAELAARGY